MDLMHGFGTWTAFVTFLNLALVSILLISAISLLLAFVLRWLWNITIPQVFGLREVTYWQAFRLLIIAGLLFGGPVYFGK